MEACSSATGGRLQVAFEEHLEPVGPRVPQPTPIVNVVATLPGTDPLSRDRLYVVSGHYDSMPSDVLDSGSDAPGANDDASGVAAVMEMACVMARHRFDSTLVFIAFAGEEQGLLGADLGEADVQNLAPQFQQVARSAERSVIIVTHDNRIFSYADRIARMDDGEIISVEEQDPKIPPHFEHEHAH